MYQISFCDFALVTENDRMTLIVSGTHQYYDHNDDVFSPYRMWNQDYFQDVQAKITMDYLPNHAESPIL